MATTTLDRSDGRLWDDPLASPASRFPLGWPKGVAPDHGEPPSGPGTRPFGLTQLVPVDADQVADLTGVRYCPHRQVSMWGEVPAVYLATKFDSPRTTRQDEQIWTDYDIDTDP